MTEKYLHPTVVLTAEETLLIYWDNGDHHLEVEVPADAKFEWFYRNRATDSHDAGSQVSALFFGYLMNMKNIAGGIFVKDRKP